MRGRSAGLNQAFSENSVAAGRNLCNKLWNVSRYVQNIVDEEDDSSVEYTTENMGEDWICRELDDCLEQIEKDIFYRDHGSPSYDDRIDVATIIYRPDDF